MCGLERLGQYKCGCLSAFALLRNSVRRVRSDHSQSYAQAIIMRIRSLQGVICSSERGDYHRVDAIATVPGWAVCDLSNLQQLGSEEIGPVCRANTINR